MQGLKKLALVAAAAALPVASFAMQPMNDSALSGVTGQDGIDISINTNAMTLGVNIYDRDGIGSSGANGLVASKAGAIVIKNMGVDTNGGAIKLAIDAGQTSTAAPVLNVNVDLTNGITLDTGDLYIGNTTSAHTDWAVTDQTSTAIMDSTQISLGQTSLNIQLGNVAQTMNGGAWKPMIALRNVSISGGITLGQQTLGSGNAFTLNDNTTADVLGGTGGTLSIDQINLADGAGGGDLTNINVGVDVTSSGLAIGVESLGDGGLTAHMTGVDLGNGSSIGDVAITGLTLGGTTITVAGH